MLLQYQVYLVNLAIWIVVMAALKSGTVIYAEQILTPKKCFEDFSNFVYVRVCELTQNGVFQNKMKIFTFIKLKGQKYTSIEAFQEYGSYDFVKAVLLLTTLFCNTVRCRNKSRVQIFNPILRTI